MSINDSYSQFCENTNTHLSVKYVSARRDRVIVSLFIGTDKIFLVANDDENASFQTDQKTFDSLTNFVITHSNNFVDLSLAKKKANSFEIALYKKNIITFRYYVFGSDADEYFDGISNLLKRNKLDKNLIKLF